MDRVLLRRGRRTSAVGLLIFVVVAAVGCSSDTAESAAELKVSAKQRALADAQATATAKAAEFCGASATYIAAVDRYGDVLNQTSTTVGDVKVAGQDLGQPESDAVAAGEAAVAARQQVTAAENELAAAEAELAAAQASASASGAAQISSPTPIPTPAGPTEAVARVQQAESEFATAQQGITDATPLRQAAQQFNAAAVAVEMAWLQLFADAGCLSNKQQEESQAAIQQYTANLQQALTDTGYYDGKINGGYGPATLEAVQALQQAHGLPVTGWVDKATEAALRSELAAEAGASAQSALASTSALQQTLKLAGFWDGPVDGQWTPALTDALKSFQKELGVPTTGTVDAATIAAVEDAIAELQSPPPSTAPPAAPSATPSGSATG